MFVSLREEVMLHVSHQNVYKPESTMGRISLESEVLPRLAGSGKLFAFRMDRFWLNIKSAGSALYANQAILELYKSSHPERLSDLPGCKGNVYIHPTAEVDDSAVVRNISKLD